MIGFDFRHSTFESVEPEEVVTAARVYLPVVLQLLGSQMFRITAKERL